MTSLPILVTDDRAREDIETFIHAYARGMEKKSVPASEIVPTSADD